MPTPENPEMVQLRAHFRNVREIAEMAIAQRDALMADNQRLLRQVAELTQQLDQQRAAA